jgi:hypothetical protein
VGGNDNDAATAAAEESRFDKVRRGADKVRGGPKGRTGTPFAGLGMSGPDAARNRSRKIAMDVKAGGRTVNMLVLTTFLSMKESSSGISV